MPTTEERVTTLESAVAEVQSLLQAKASISQVVNITNAVETRLDTNDTDHISYEDRLSKLERWVTSVRSTLQVLNDQGVATKVNLSATVAPAITDDVDLGYSVGSRWFNVSADDEYVCLDATDGAAVWKKTTP